MAFLEGSLKPEWWLPDSRAITLLRVSSLRQKDNTSHETQESEVAAYCEENGLELMQVFRIVESAKDSDSRKKYHEALKFAKRRGIKHVLFYMFDRETRNLTDNEANEKEVRLGNLVLHYVRDRKVIHRRSSESDFMMRDFQAVSNKQFIRNLSAKISDGMRQKAERGWYPGNHLPLGYTQQRLKDAVGKELKRGTIIVPCPVTAPIVQKEFELRAKHFTLEQIREACVHLVPAHKVASYDISSIGHRFHSKFYRGYFTWQGEEFKGQHELIIDSETLAEVDEIVDLGIRYTKKQQSGIFGGGWLKCASSDCGCHVVYDPKVKVLSTGERKTYHLYHCTNGKGVHQSMRGMNIREEKIWESLGSAVSDISICEDRAQAIADALNETHRKACNAIHTEMEGFRAGIEAIKLKRNKLVDMLLNETLSQSDFKEQINRLDDEHSRFTVQLENAQVAISGAYMKTATDILELATRAKSLWESRTAEERKLFLELILSNRVLDGVSVRYELKKEFAVLKEMNTDSRWWTHLELFRTTVIEIAG